MAVQKIPPQCAFVGGSSDLITASRRFYFTTTDGAQLNVECFEKDDDQSSSHPTLLFLHGVCESAETWSVQHFARACQSKQWRLIVLELEGHGLSSGSRAVCPDFHRLRRHISEFAASHLCEKSNKFAICGTSLGGILAGYVADSISSQNFLGTAFIAPAVGVSQDALPPCIIVSALRFVSMLAPKAKLPFTPLEDPSHYACPVTSTRNFKGHWPLSTSKMLLDVTSEMVTRDLKSNKLKLDKCPVLIVTGNDDDIVPFDNVHDFYDHIRSEEKTFVEIPDAGHDLMFQPETAQDVVEKVFDWLEQRLDKDG